MKTKLKIDDESSYDTRDKLVRNLQPHEAGDLLVHCHVITNERRKALLFLRGPADAYFDKDEQVSIRKWIETEDYLPQDSKLADHPKKPTHWCNYCGHIERCEHDDKRKANEETLEELRYEIHMAKSRERALRDKIKELEAAFTNACRLVAMDNK